MAVWYSNFAADFKKSSMFNLKFIGYEHGTNITDPV